MSSGVRTRASRYETVRCRPGMSVSSMWQPQKAHVSESRSSMARACALRNSRCVQGFRAYASEMRTTQYRAFFW